MLKRNFIFSLSLLLGILVESGEVLSADFREEERSLPQQSEVYYEGVHIQTAFLQRDDLRIQLKIIGKEYLDTCKAQSGHVNNEFIESLFERYLPVMLTVSQGDIRAMIDGYEHQTNPGAILAHMVSGTSSLRDDTRISGYIFVALAQLFKQKEDEMMHASREGVHNLFNIPLVENDPLYRKTMGIGLNRLIGSMTGREATIYALGNEGLEAVRSDSKETSEEKEGDALSDLYFLTTLANEFLPKETLENSVVATWENDSLALFAQYPASPDVRGRVIQQKIENGYASLVRLIASAPHQGQETTDHLFTMVEEYLYAVLNGRLYGNKEFRDEGKALQEALFIRTKMSSLVALCFQKQNPDLSSKENRLELVRAVTNYLREKQPYAMVLESFKFANDQTTDQFMLNWPEYGGIWSELIFNYSKAKQIFDKHKDQIFVANQK